jgi:hypothetical protein
VGEEMSVDIAGLNDFQGDGPCVGKGCRREYGSGQQHGCQHDDFIFLHVLFVCFLTAKVRIVSEIEDEKDKKTLFLWWSRLFLVLLQPIRKR